MRIALEKKWTDLLTRLPESGMGYQRVDLHFSDGSWARDVLVFNAEEAEVPEGFAKLPITEITLHDRHR